MSKYPSWRKEHDHRRKHTETPMELLIKTHYHKVFFQNEWTYARVRRLCEILQLTEKELGALIGHDKGRPFEYYAKRAKFTGPTRILLELLERYYRRKIYGEKFDSELFPNLDTLSNG